ncbi:MAG: 2-amino-4-hydroxy-6-hydroxymethyldihydropteridine diphosphokinase [Kiritimatiellia bacterium]|nr:2-amino-4-hydroxy-6-hydroxymethyldihydropteridine diphosphokinase [Kiritimatiellia bacterium]
MEIGLSLGANLGNRLLQLQEAKKQIVATKGIAFVAKSSVYETEPVGVSPQDSNLLFLNAILVIETSLPLSELFVGFRRIECQLGRAHQPEPNAPRPMDIDVIYADKLRANEGGVIIPHPRWAGRRFVVQPLNDVRPDLIIPGQPGTVAEVLSRLPDEHKVMLFAKEW